MDGEWPATPAAGRLGYRAAEGAVAEEWRAPDAAQRTCGALLIRGLSFRLYALGPGSAEQREGRCTASGTPATLFLKRLVLQRLGDRAQILPRHPLVGRRPQQISRVKRGDGADGAGAGVVIEPAPAGFHDALAGLQQRLRRGIAERHQHARIDP